MKTINFGIIGCGLMGRELASAMARWCHLSEMDARPEIVAVCDRNEASRQWFEGRTPVGPPVDGRVSRAPGQRRGGGGLLRGAAQPAPGALLRDPRCGQAPAGREAVRHRQAGQRRDPGLRGAASAAVSCAARRSCRSSPPMQRIVRDDRGGRVRPADRGQHRLPSLERPRPGQADQLEARWSRSTANTA